MPHSKEAMTLGTTYFYISHSKVCCQGKPINNSAYKLGEIHFFRFGLEQHTLFERSMNWRVQMFIKHSWMCGHCVCRKPQVSSTHRYVTKKSLCNMSYLFVTFVHHTECCGALLVSNVLRWYSKKLIWISVDRKLDRLEQFLGFT